MSPVGPRAEQVAVSQRGSGSAAKERQGGWQQVTCCWVQFPAVTAELFAAIQGKSPGLFPFSNHTSRHLYLGPRDSPSCLAIYCVWNNNLTTMTCAEGNGKHICTYIPGIEIGNLLLPRITQGKNKGYGILESSVQRSVGL
jgi:hypothetical protein